MENLQCESCQLKSSDEMDYYNSIFKACDICSKLWCRQCQQTFPNIFVSGNSGDYCSECYKIKDEYWDKYWRSKTKYNK